MTFKIVNRVRMSLSAAGGTGTLTLNSQTAGFQSFTSGGMVDGDSTPYVIEDGSPIGTSWEIGQGTYHSNGTFSRDTVTQSSLGGTTKISVSANAILNATMRAQDLAFAGALATLNDVDLGYLNDGDLLSYDLATSKWVNSLKPGGSTPTVVQVGHICSSSSGPQSITLGDAPTAGNLLLIIGFGGGQSVFGGGYEPGLNNIGSADRVQSWTLDQQTSVGYAMHNVRSGESATQVVGLGDPGSTIPFGAVLVEIAGADLTRMSEFFMSRTSVAVGSGATDLSVLSEPGALILGFVGGTSGAQSGLYSLIAANGSGAYVNLGAGNASFNYAAFQGFNSSGLAEALLMSFVGV